MSAGLEWSTKWPRKPSEHYEISRYGAMKAWAKQLGMKDAEKLLDETLKEEIKTDLILSMLAEMAMNPKAAGK